MLLLIDMLLREALLLLKHAKYKVVPVNAAKALGGEDV
jgi:hypothetical protein